MTKSIQIALESRPDGVAIVQLTGRLDFATAPEAREFLTATLAAGHRYLVIDLGEVEFVDSAGLGALIFGVRKARQTGGDLCIVDPQVRVRLLMNLTALDQVINLYATMEEALGVVPSGETPPLLNLRMPATAAGMDILHQSLDTCWAILGEERVLESRWREAFTLAVAEVAANVIQYAHPPEATNPQFAMSLTNYPDRLAARFVDWGPAVLPSDDSAVMPPVAESGDHLRDHGRGLAIIRMTTDHFEYQRTAAGENLWLIEKTFDASPTRQDPAGSPDAGQ